VHRRSRITLLVWFCCLRALPIAAAEPEYDLLLRGGHVIDPRNNQNSVLDVAITGDEVAKIAADIPPHQAHRVVAVNGLFVVPGLVDIHTHVYAGTGGLDVLAGDRSLYPDGHTFRSGVTTVVDAGTSGWRTFPDFKQRVIDRAQTRVLALLNIVGGGMSGRPNEQRHEDMDPQAAAAMAKQFPELIVGIKTAHYDGPEWIAVERAIAAGELAKVPVMVDFGTFRSERPFQQLVLEKMRPGDIYTHLYLDKVPMLDESDMLLPYLREARRRGVRFDLGHGRDSFHWWQVVPANRQGWLPDSISTDLWNGNMNAGMKDMLNVMSKFVNLGVPLDEVVRLSTCNPAGLIGRPDLGHLAVGAAADIALLRVHSGDYGFLDSGGVRLPGTQKLECELTVRDGKVVWDLNGRAGKIWDGKRP